MVATSIDNIEDEKPLLHNSLPSSADLITILLHYHSIKLKFFILNIIVISDVIAIFMLSIKNAISLAKTDCVSRMVMEVVPQETKKEYLDPAFSFASNVFREVTNTCYQSVTDVS